MKLVFSDSPCDILLLSVNKANKNQIIKHPLTTNLETRKIIESNRNPKMQLLSRYVLNDLKQRSFYPLILDLAQWLYSADREERQTVCIFQRSTPWRGEEARTHNSWRDWTLIKFIIKEMKKRRKRWQHTCARDNNSKWFLASHANTWPGNKIAWATSHPLPRKQYNSFSWSCQKCLFEHCRFFRWQDVWFAWHVSQNVKKRPSSHFHDESPRSVCVCTKS